MSLRFAKHTTFEQVTQEFKALDGGKQAKIVFANRAPNASDKGVDVWINEDGAPGSRWYFRHSKTGAWTTQ